MPVLDPESPLPLYYQLVEVLRRQIREGRYAPHAAIPAEPELVASYLVSRSTVRLALMHLVSEGLLYRRQGKGTFVSAPPAVGRVWGEVVSLTEELRRRGKRPGGRLVTAELVRGTASVRARLCAVDDEQVLCLERIREADGIPIAYERDSLPYPRASRVYERAADAASGSLYSLMADEGLRPFCVEESLCASLPSAREQDLLGLGANEPGMRLTATTFDQTGAPLAYTEAFFVGSRYDFQLALRISTDGRQQP